MHSMFDYGTFTLILQLKTKRKRRNRKDKSLRKASSEFSYSTCYSSTEDELSRSNSYDQKDAKNINSAECNKVMNFSFCVCLFIFILFVLIYILVKSMQLL